MIIYCQVRPILTLPLLKLDVLFPSPACHVVSRTGCWLGWNFDATNRTSDEGTCVFSSYKVCKGLRSKHDLALLCTHSYFNGSYWELGGTGLNIARHRHEFVNINSWGFSTVISIWFPCSFLYMNVLMGILHVLNPYNPGHLGNDATTCRIYLAIHTLHFTNTLSIMCNVYEPHFVKTYVSKVSHVKYDTDSHAALIMNKAYIKECYA